MLSKKLDQLINELKKELGLFLSISFGIFLFILFFQPFTFGNFDFNNSLLFVAGMGTMTFIIITLVRITIPGIIRNDTQSRKIIFPAYFNSFLIVVLSSLAYVFYLRFVGMLHITFFLTIKIMLICLAPALILSIHDYVNDLNQQIELLTIEKMKVHKEIEKYKDDVLNKSIEFISENSLEKFELALNDIAVIKSADNYVEIVYKEGAIFKKKLIRNTLRNIEVQLRQYSIFVRCHRICIVNLHFIGKLVRENNNYSIQIKGYDEQLPVSRQYLLKLKEAI
jgi:DNA-binding LytR/AlgR family response regulator